MTLPKDRAIVDYVLEMKMRFDPDEVQSALRKSWSLATAHQWTLENPAAGQCNVTALLVHELFGGDLLKTPLLGRRAGSNKRPVSRSQRCLFSGGLRAHYLKTVSVSAGCLMMTPGVRPKLHGFVSSNAPCGRSGESGHEQRMTAELQRPYLASYCMIRANDTILVQRRFNTGYLDGHWALPSGHAIDGEDALAAASRELLEETSLIVKSDDWRFVCAMHRRTDRTIIDLFFTTNKFFGTPRICEPTKCDGLAFFSMNALPQPLAGYIGVALDCLKGIKPRHGSYYGEGWS